MRAKVRNEGSPFTSAPKVRQTEGIQGVNPPFTGIHQNVTNGVKRWTLCDRKAQNVNAFSLQKTQAARPERAEAHSPGQHPGYKAISNAPCKGKSFKTPGNFLKLLPLQVGCVGQTFERGIWQQNHGSEYNKRGTECDNRGSECDNRGSEKREKNSRKRINSQKQWLSLQNKRKSLDRAFCTAWSRSNGPSLGR